MASRTLPGLGLNGFWNLGESWKNGGDENWLKISVMAQLVVESVTAALPTSPSNGVVHIVPTSDATNKGKVAVRDNGAWVYFQPPIGAQAWVKDTNKRMRYDSTGTWVDATSSTTGSAPVVTESGAARSIAASDAGSYIRFTATGAKTATFDGSAVTYATGQEYHITNRASSGDLALQVAGGVSLAAPKGGTLTLEPGDTVTVKFVGATSADVMGSTKASA